MASIALLTVLVVTIFAMIALWRGRRPFSAVGHLKGETVSREWLLQHQEDDR